MRLRIFLSLLLTGLLLGGCATDQRYSEHKAERQAQQADPHPVNPFSNGGFRDPGPNYPATGD